MRMYTTVVFAYGIHTMRAFLDVLESLELAKINTHTSDHPDVLALLKRARAL